MTQYNNVVERQRQILAMEVWAKGVKQIYAHDGIIETWYNNGDIHYEENKPKGKEWTVKSNLSEEELLVKHGRFQVDNSVKYNDTKWNIY